MRSASLDVKPCTGTWFDVQRGRPHRGSHSATRARNRPDSGRQGSTPLVTEWTSRRRSSGTVPAKRQTLNGTSGVASSRCLLIPLANSTIIEIQRGNVSWLRALPRCLQTHSTSSATGPLRTGTSVLPTARSHTRLARVESDLIVLLEPPPSAQPRKRERQNRNASPEQPADTSPADQSRTSMLLATIRSRVCGVGRMVVVQEEFSTWNNPIGRSSRLWGWWWWRRGGCSGKCAVLFDRRDERGVELGGEKGAIPGRAVHEGHALSTCPD
jgi:hypothetical protein